VRLPVADPVAQNTSAPLDLTKRRIAIGLHCWSSRPAHRAASSQELRRRRPAPALRPPHLRGPFLLSCCTSSARAGRCCPAPCSPSRPGLGVPDSRRTAGARVSAENCCGLRSRSVRRLRLSHLIQWFECWFCHWRRLQLSFQICWGFSPTEPPCPTLSPRPC